MNAYSGKNGFFVADEAQSRRTDAFDTAPRHEIAAPEGVMARIAGLLRAVAQMPRRWSVMNELHMLSDRELADMGLHRGELRRVFDADFARQREFASQG